VPLTITVKNGTTTIGTGTDVQINIGSGTNNITDTTTFDIYDG
jgi:hypothetical protein